MKDPYAYDKILDIQRQILIFSALNEDNAMAGFIRDCGTLHHIVITGSLVEDPIKKAAWYLYSLANYAPFLQGNKRTAYRIATDVLMMGEPRFEIFQDVESVTQFIKKIGNSECDLDDVENWLSENISKIE
jgi:prophage maintenance system killer protein